MMPAMPSHVCMRHRLLLAAVLVSALAEAGDWVAGAKLYQQRKFAAALAELEAAIDRDPANAKAYMYAALSAEELGEWTTALKHWRNYKALDDSSNAALFADSHIASARAALGDKVPPSRLTQPHREQLRELLPHFVTVKSEHFLVRARSKAMAELAAKAAEGHLQRIRSALLGNAAWPRVVTINIYRDKAEYLKEAGDAHLWSGGSYTHRRLAVDAVTRAIHLYQLDRRGRYRAGLLTRSLPHELTHVVMHEFFGERDVPRWLNEGLAMFAEEGTARVYNAQLAAILNTQRHIPLQKLFAMEVYPLHPWLFYAESASVVRFLLSELDDKQTLAFLHAMKGGLSFEAALRKATDREDATLAAFEARWRSSVGVR